MLSSSSLKTKLVRTFATHTRVAVVGGGAAGSAASSQLARSGQFAPEDITVFDPSSTHYYQPSLTMIGGGVLGSSQEQVSKKETKYFRKPMDEMIYPGVNWIPEKVVQFDPDQNQISSESD